MAPVPCLSSGPAASCLAGLTVRGIPPRPAGPIATPSVLTTVSTTAARGSSQGSALALLPLGCRWSALERSAEATSPTPGPPGPRSGRPTPRPLRCRTCLPVGVIMTPRRFATDQEVLTLQGRVDGSGLSGLPDKVFSPVPGAVSSVVRACFRPDGPCIRTADRV